VCLGLIKCPTRSSIRLCKQITNVLFPYNGYRRKLRLLKRGSAEFGLKRKGQVSSESPAYQKYQEGESECSGVHSQVWMQTQKDWGRDLWVSCLCRCAFYPLHNFAFVHRELSSLPNSPLDLQRRTAARSSESEYWYGNMARKEVGCVCLYMTRIRIYTTRQKIPRIHTNLSTYDLWQINLISLR
jgi:hypothetical protein